MTKAIEQRHFYVGELPDGRAVAASNSSPFFCFRADSEEAVLAKVDAALTFYFNSPKVAHPAPRNATATVNSWTNKRAVPFKEYLTEDVVVDKSDPFVIVEDINDATTLGSEIIPMPPENHDS